MDEHGPDVPEQTLRTNVPNNSWKALQQRQYLPTLADLIDRLTIVMLKQINIPENREAYDAERKMLENDIAQVLLERTNATPWPGVVDLISAVAVIMLANKTIWDNESKARAGGSEQDHLLKFTHSINGVRSRAKNVIAKATGERIDVKTDCLASDLPKEFGNWDGII